VETKLWVSSDMEEVVSRALVEHDVRFTEPLNKSLSAQDSLTVFTLLNLSWTMWNNVWQTILLGKAKTSASIPDSVPEGFDDVLVDAAKALGRKEVIIGYIEIERDGNRYEISKNTDRLQWEADLRAAESKHLCE